MTERPLLDSWLAHIERLDLDGLLGLYHPDAVVEWCRERWSGHDELREALSQFGRHLRKFRVESVEPSTSGSGRVAFRTGVRGPFGTRHIEHEWAVDPTGIRSHRAQFA